MAIPKQPKKIEYRNTTEHEIIWIDKGATPIKEGRPYRVLPGKSVHITEEDYNILVVEGEDKRFTEGKLRRADKLDTIVASEIIVRDDMSELEIKMVVENAISLKSLALKIRQLTSIATANAFMAECEKQDKPISWLKSCLKKVNSLSDQLHIKFKYQERDNKKTERDQLKEAVNVEQD